MKRFLVTVPIVGAGLMAALGLTIALGGPGKPPPAMSSIGDPFKDVDFSDLPEVSYVTARDGTKLAFRAYPAAGDAVKGSVVLVHGSSATGSSMHLMARGFAAAGYAAFALDVRGHGKSGSKGHIAYIGQLEDDVEDFVHSTKLAQPCTLAGFSSGGGFVLRFAGSPRQELFSNYLLLSPWISQDAATLRPGNGGWATVGVPRIIATAVLDGFGVHVFDDLPVVRFAVDERDKGLLTPQYSFALAQNFRPERLPGKHSSGEGTRSGARGSKRRGVVRRPVCSRFQGSWQRCSCGRSPGDRPHLTHTRSSRRPGGGRGGRKHGSRKA